MLPGFHADAALARPTRSYTARPAPRRGAAIVAQDPFSSSCCRFCASMGQGCMELEGRCYCVPRHAARTRGRALTLLRS
jgi:hypothetical protein